MPFQATPDFLPVCSASVPILPTDLEAWSAPDTNCRTCSSLSRMETMSVLAMESGPHEGVGDVGGQPLLQLKLEPVGLLCEGEQEGSLSTVPGGQEAPGRQPIEGELGRCPHLRQASPRAFSSSSTPLAEAHSM